MQFSRANIFTNQGTQHDRRRCRYSNSVVVAWPKTCEPAAEAGSTQDKDRVHTRVNAGLHAHG